MIQTWGAPLLSGAMLALCFPTWHLYFLAWVALTPLLAPPRPAPRGGGSAFLCCRMGVSQRASSVAAHQLLLGGGCRSVGQQAVWPRMAAYWAATGAARSWLRGRLPWDAGVLVVRGTVDGQLEYAQTTCSAVLAGAIGVFAGRILRCSSLPPSEGRASRGRARRIQRTACGSDPYAQAPVRARGNGLPLLIGTHGGRISWCNPVRLSPFQVGVFQPNFPLE